MDTRDISKVASSNKISKLVLFELLEKIEELNDLDKDQFTLWISTHYVGKFEDYREIGIYLVTTRVDPPIPDWLEDYIDFELYVKDMEEEKQIMVITFLCGETYYLFTLDQKE